MTAAARNLEALKAWERAYQSDGDEAALAMIEELFHPEVEFSPRITRELEGRTLRGREELRGFFQDLGETMGGVHYEPAEFQRVSDDVILLTTRLVGTGRGSTVPIGQDLSSVYEFEDGVVRRLSAYGSYDEALSKAREAAGA